MSKYLVAATTFVVFVSQASAYKPAPPASHATTSPDGQHVFVILSHETMKEELTRFNEQWQPKIRAIREKWSKSGMYRNDGSTEPLWTVDWHAYQVDVPSGGEYVVRYTSGGYYWKSNPAVAFYRRGELLRSYEIGDLVSVPFVIDHGDWLADHTLDDSAGTVRVNSETGDRFVFDVRTGEIVSSFRLVRVVVIAVLGLAVLGGAAWVRRRRQSLKKRTSHTGGDKRRVGTPRPSLTLRAGHLFAIRLPSR